jgi:hypothetical protein
VAFGGGEKNASCDKARRAHLPAARSSLPAAWERLPDEPPDLIPSWSGTSDLAFEATSRGIAWHFSGQCREKKEGEHSPVHGEAPQGKSYMKLGRRGLCAFVVKLCASVPRSPPPFPPLLIFDRQDELQLNFTHSSRLARQW